MPEWQMLDARLSVFVTPDTVVPPSLFRDVVGEDPENSATQRLTSTKIDSGPLADGSLDLQIQPTRIDWTYHPSGVPTPPFLGSFPASADPLLKLGRHWTGKAWFPSATRVALAFTLLSKTESRESGYKELGRFVEGVPTAPDATDFMYQVNRPRESAAGFDINRLSKWSVMGYRFLTVTPLTSQAIDFQLHLRLDLDINTSAEFQGIIPLERIDAVVDDLLIGACEISERGTRF